MEHAACFLRLKDAFCCSAAACLLVFGGTPVAAGSSTALVDYVTGPDDTFEWEKVEERSERGVTTARVALTTQTWRGHSWTHQLLIARPDTVRNPDIAFLMIIGDGKVEKQLPLLRTLATRAGAVAAAVNRVPNQPLYGGRNEDALIAYTFEQFLQSGDPTWPLLFPMVKSAVKAMDAVQAFAREEWDQRIARFAVGGASKRGWTSWLTAAADPRVKAIAPMAIDMLNMKAQTEWAQEMYGRQSEQIQDYTEYNFTERMDEPRMVRLRSWVDPYSYREEYTLPKLLLLGTNDPYWVVDSLRHYWDQLPQPKLVYQTPNAGHDLGGGGQATETLAAFFQMIADRQPLPRMVWQWSTNAVGLKLEVQLDRPADSFRLWTANSTDRDFRDETWSSRSIESANGTNAAATIPAAPKGFRAALIEAELTSPTGEPYRLSTEARVTPDGPPPR